MSDLRAKIRLLISDREARDKHYDELMKSKDDLISIVLRGHLIVEELLFSAISAHCQAPEHLRSTQFRFHQLIALLRALQKLPAVPEHHWNALLELNSLRNALSHNLEPRDLSARVERFVKSVRGDSDHLKDLPGPPDSQESLRAALAYLFGAISVVAVFQAATEELIKHQLLDANKQSIDSADSAT